MEKEGLGGKKIIVWDHNRDLLYQRASTLLDDPQAARYAWGMGFHWYEDWSGGTPMYENVKRVHEAYPDKPIIFTEGCAESFNPTRYNAWVLGEEYGRSMINDFNNGMTALPTGIFYWMKPADLIMYRIFVLRLCMVIQSQVSLSIPMPITISGIFPSS